MAYQALGKYQEEMLDRERACVFADGVHHYICEIDFSRCLVRIGDYRRAVKEARVGAASADLPGVWRLEGARTFSVSTGLVERDASVPPDQRTRLSKEYKDSAIDELKRCAAQGVFADEVARQELATGAAFAAIRRQPEFEQLQRVVGELIDHRAARSEPAARVPGDSK
jgi:hypothetical protein